MSGLREVKLGVYEEECWAAVPQLSRLQGLTHLELVCGGRASADTLVQAVSKVRLGGRAHYHLSTAVAGCLAGCALPASLCACYGRRTTSPFGGYCRARMHLGMLTMPAVE